MRVFLDSSALAKRYFRENGTDAVTGVCSRADEIIMSSICAIEIVSALNRLLREKKLASRQYEALKADLAADVGQATIVDVTPPVIRSAVHCLEHSRLRALDAILVASAKESMCDLFVSADERQCHAARLLKLRVEKV